MGSPEGHALRRFAMPQGMTTPLPTTARGIAVQRPETKGPGNRVLRRDEGAGKAPIENKLFAVIERTAKKKR